MELQYTPLLKIRQDDWLSHSDNRDPRGVLPVTRTALEKYATNTYFFLFETVDFQG